MAEEMYKAWQNLFAATYGLCFLAGATVLIGVLTNQFPPPGQSKERER